MAKSKKAGKKEKDVQKEIEFYRDEESLDAKPVEWKDDSDVLAPVQDEKGDKKKEIVKSMFARERVITESSDDARNFYARSSFGTIIEAGRVQLSLLEALYLLEKGKLEIIDRKKKISSEDFISRAKKVEPNFWIRYCVFKDMRNRGYIIKTALKFGADFRVYDRGIKPGQDHARWIIFPVHEGETLTWYEFAAKNRVAHSTKKRLMMGIVDDEGDVTYYEIKWMRP
jgi:tRNA-intron endonuclease, archaea type